MHSLIYVKFKTYQNTPKSDQIHPLGVYTPLKRPIFVCFQGSKYTIFYLFLKNKLKNDKNIGSNVGHHFNIFYKKIQVLPYFGQKVHFFN